MNIYFIYDRYIDESVWDIEFYSNCVLAEEALEQKIAFHQLAHDRNHDNVIAAWKKKSAAFKAIKETGLSVPYEWSVTVEPPTKRPFHHNFSIEELEVNE